MSLLDRLGISSKSDDNKKEIPKGVRKEIELRADNLKMEVALGKKPKEEAEKELCWYIQSKIRESNPRINPRSQDNDKKIRRYVANKFDDSELEKLKSKGLRSEMKRAGTRERVRKGGPPEHRNRDVAPASGGYMRPVAGRHDYPVGAVAGTVVDQEGKPVSDTHVIVHSSIGPIGAKTDENGEFFIDNVPASKIPYQPGTQAEACSVDVYKDYSDELGGTHRAEAHAKVVVSAGDVNPTRPESIKLDIKSETREEQVKDYLRGKGPKPKGYKGPAPGTVKAAKPLALISEKIGSSVKTAVFSLMLFVIGIAVSAAFGSIWFVLGFSFWAFHVIIPDPEAIKLADKIDNKIVRRKDPETGEIIEEEKKVIDDKTGKMAAWGSYMANQENRTNTGLAFMKAVTKVGMVVCFIGGLYTTQLPMANFALLFLAFGFYFSMPVEFEPTKPYEFILSACRFLLALFIGFFIFGALGGGIFQSKELGWLTLAFFAVLPVATEKKNLARALGIMGSGSGESYDMIDKIVFGGIMLLFALLAGFNMFGLFGEGGAFFTGTAGIVFGAVWLLGVLTGLTTPASTRPWMGIIILMVGFLVFGLGVGQQAMGTALFGQWWPTMHNTANEFFKPLGDMFSQFQMTFGQTFMLITNPVEYAKQITQGTYTQNELGVTGAYGLEIRKFDVQSIYIDEPFMIQIELENKGIYTAKNIKVNLLTNIKGFNISIDGTHFYDLKPLENGKDKYGKQWYNYTIDKLIKINDIERQDAIPLFVYGKMSCDTFKGESWKDFGVVGGKEHTIREYFMPFVLNVTYDYEATSNLQIDFISNDEWKRLSAENKLNRGPKASLISTSPASLNLGSMDQPIKEDSPFYVGFNLTTTWPKNTLITGGKINFYLHGDFKPYSDWSTTCTKEYSGVLIIDGDYSGYYKFTFDLTKSSSKDAFCSFSGLKQPPRPLTAPMKTYTIFADAAYTFSKWESKDTLFNFKDTCWPEEQLKTGSATTPSG